MAFIKVKKINLGLDKLKSGEGFAPLLKAFGATQEMLNEIPEEETVYINTDRIIGITGAVPTCLGDESKCCKVYFAKDDYWTIEYDETILIALGVK